MSHESAPFTPRESQIFLAIAAGLSCRDIGTRLSITESTVRKHRSNMLNKLGLRNAAELLSYARNAG
ncbi:LuxR C-terminal-related transcriptional regulator [Janthinobacterium sp. HH107]|uniref:response regulator transcription factor n=1 Tax=Janthinobacterium sp. HH107 TaxID=1537279 RepID=UPI0008FC9553|nr:LuxR C-terminal-related transcriptional regulator [Janthinobacterium sp. HH107]